MPWTGRCPDRAAAAFSLVEVTLALGIVTFALVGVIGILPVAMTSSRQSIDRNRAAAVASTVYASFRSQPFQKVYYLTTDLKTDGTPRNPTSNATDPNALDLSSLNSTSQAKTFYATFLDVSTPVGDTGDTFGIQRRLCFTADSSRGGADYLVTMRFNNQPDGMAKITDASGTPVQPVQANQVELSISPVSRPADRYRFISLIANRTN